MTWSEPTLKDKATANMWLIAIEIEADMWTLLSPKQQEAVQARIEWVKQYRKEPDGDVQ